MSMNRRSMSLTPWLTMLMIGIVILIGIVALAGMTRSTMSAPGAPTVGPLARLTVLAESSPTCPVVRPGQSDCAPRPLANASVSLLSSSGMALKAAISGPDGTLFFLVAPGSYILHAQTGNTGGYGMLPRPPADQGVLVPLNGLMVTLEYDSGIR